MVIHEKVLDYIHFISTIRSLQYMGYSYSESYGMDFVEHRTMDPPCQTRGSVLHPAGDVGVLEAGDATSHESQEKCSKSMKRKGCLLLNHSKAI